MQNPVSVAAVSDRRPFLPAISAVGDRRYRVLQEAFTTDRSFVGSRRENCRISNIEYRMAKGPPGMQSTFRRRSFDVLRFDIRQSAVARHGSRLFVDLQSYSGS
jgi:hypothetical protein